MPSSSSPSKFRLSVDSWAVLVAIVLSILVRAGILKAVSW
jgi:hypothetical protein